MRKKPNTSTFTSCLRLLDPTVRIEIIRIKLTLIKSTHHRKINKLLITFMLGWESILIKSVEFPPLKIDECVTSRTTE